MKRATNLSIFFDFLSDCIHLKNQVKPIEVIRYEALQNGLEYLLTALTGCQALLKFAFMIKHLKTAWLKSFLG